MNLVRRLIRMAWIIMRTKPVVAVTFGVGLILVSLNIWSIRFIETKNCDNVITSSNVNASSSDTKRPLVYAAFGRKLETGYLEHVFTELERAGYIRGSLHSSWDILWSHEYPFRVMKDQLVKLAPHQKVNHFPGSGYVTNKVNLATSGLPHVPTAFKIPDQKAELIAYAKKYPDRLFVQKSNNHRGIRIQPLSELDLETPGTFVQEYIHNPFLIDGHKFDIGVYTIITSIQPLRVYIYDGDILFRFCPEKYHPFNASVVDKYVVGDEYLPIWMVPSLKTYYNELGFGMKESFNAYMRTIGLDPKVIWNQIDDALRAMLLSRELAVAAATSNFPSSHNFFEMIRVDFVIDEDLDVFIMEANMSPNLSSQHFPPNRLLYEQVIHNILKLVGVIPINNAMLTRNSDAEDELMEQNQVAFKDLAVFPDECGKCSNCSDIICKLCKSCLTAPLKATLREAFKEHTRRHLCRRVIPPTLTPEEVEHGIQVKGLTEINQLMHKWFHGKCQLDHSWC